MKARHRGISYRVEAMSSELHRIPMLVDGDNAQASLFKNALAEAAKYGTVTTRRIYGLT